MELLLSHTQPAKVAAGRTELAEVLRCELWARGRASRRWLCERAQRVLEPMRLLELDFIREVLEELEEVGDATTGPGGLVAAAPLRAVCLGPGLFNLHGTLPTRLLRPRLPGQLEDTRSPRRSALTAEEDSAFRQAVKALGGLVLSAKRWAGLDRVPAAGPGWIEGLDQRLEQGALAAAASDEDTSGWRCYLPQSGESSQFKRWRTENDETVARLWRTRDDRGWWRWAWTGSGSPSVSLHLRLTRDEACRTMFALDRAAGTPLRCPHSVDAGQVELLVDGFLPRAEYRYLITVGERLTVEGAPRYRVSEALWLETEAMLRDRLGIDFSAGRVLL